MKTVLYIAAKAPRAGEAKTRLGQAIGHEQAVALYRAFLQDIAARFTDAPFPIGWYVTPPDAWSELAALVGRGGSALVLAQGPGDWSERQRALFAGAAARGEDRVILVASDAPQITVDVVVAAFAALDEHDLVVGPGYDGGYYLIGMRGWHDVLCGIRMSTHTVLEDILARARSLGIAVAQVAPMFDVDEIQDLGALRTLAQQRPDLAATRAALLRLNLPDTVPDTIEVSVLAACARVLARE
jgi:rSAM/selenodomain-associated transferase 1